MHAFRKREEKKFQIKDNLFRPGHGSDIRVFEGICDLLRKPRISI